ncbi:MAG: WhiB family transcriptional regulator [Dermatophilaceae bacterium]
MTRQDRRTRLAQAIADVTADATRSALAGIAWQTLGSCTARTDLPWTTDTTDISPWDADTMRTVCSSCPVRAACDTYATEHDVTGGWWAGRDRDPDADPAPSPSWVPIKVKGGRLDIEQGLLPVVTRTCQPGGAVA